MRKSLLLASVVALTTGVADLIAPKSEEPVAFKVVVVAKGVPSDAEAPPPICGQAKRSDREGLNIWAGAWTAYKDLKAHWHDGDKFALVPSDEGYGELIDDNEKKARVKQHARELQADSGVLAVIGYSRSGTTRWRQKYMPRRASP